MDWNDEKYTAAKAYWDEIFEKLQPRDNSDEEHDAFYNAIEDVFF